MAGSVRKMLHTVCTCVATPVGAQARPMCLCKKLDNGCPCLKTSVYAPANSMCMSRSVCNVSRFSKMSVSPDLRAILMLIALYNTCPCYVALV